MATPTEDVWRSWGFFQRLDWAVRENSRQGPRLPSWILVATYGRFLFQNVAFLPFLWYLPSGVASSSVQEAGWEIFLRYTAWTYALDSLGVRNGPMLDGRFTPWPYGMFTIARYRLTRGTLKVARFSCFGKVRTTLDVLFYVILLGALTVAIALPTFLQEGLRVAVLCSAWSFVSDHQQFFASQSTTYFYVLLAGCFPTEQGGLACTQLHVMLVWIGSGLGKIGPWFLFVNGPFLSSSVWLRGRSWLPRLLYRGESDFRPTFLISLVGHLAPHFEWIAPLMLLCVGSPLTVRVGIVVLVAMHVYILLAPAARDIYNWNGWFIVAAIYLFGGGASFGFDFESMANAPLPLAILFGIETLAVVVGVFRPDLVSYQTGHRNWAGNWSQAVILLKKNAAAKLTDSLTTYGRPAWNAVPESIPARRIKEVR
eukprot:TRINITY_DN24625_c0_g1_i1.p1 TRINITY_DN24625_c0_g1~~TRINITY_DN24625_c0_g1_i1.p1  ORF type:complete len:426 (-),score=2.94 TRINITY_DN24625_c0_g1_i1:162-1439(-)